MKHCLVNASLSEIKGIDKKSVVIANAVFDLFIERPFLHLIILLYNFEIPKFYLFKVYKLTRH